MPLYEYLCTECGHAEEHLVRGPVPGCVNCSEQCGGEATRQVPLLARSVADCGPASSGST
jgi:putative FmdB family regulatory protein